jgi:hypothetical protein
MSDQTFSDLVEIAKRNRNFRQNYRKIIGAFLYLRSISAIGGRSVFWNGLIFTAITGALAWLEKHGWSYFGS